MLPLLLPSATTPLPPLARLAGAVTLLPRLATVMLAVRQGEPTLSPLSCVVADMYRSGPTDDCAWLDTLMRAADPTRGCASWRACVQGAWRRGR